MSVGDGELPPGHAAWIVKFRAGADPVDIGPLEQYYAGMARAAGVTIGETRLIAAADGPPRFAARRFDRPGGGPRVHMVSLAGAIEAPPQIPGTIDYDMFLRATRAITRDEGDVFRRTMFNVLAGNRDDHARQHAYLMDDAGERHLAPAYDLTFSDGPGGEHTLAIAGEGARPTRAHVDRIARTHGIAPRIVAAIVEQVAGPCARHRGQPRYDGNGRGKAVGDPRGVCRARVTRRRRAARIARRGQAQHFALPHRRQVEQRGDEARRAFGRTSKRAAPASRSISRASPEKAMARRDAASSDSVEPSGRRALRRWHRPVVRPGRGRAAARPRAARPSARHRPPPPATRARPASRPSPRDRRGGDGGRVPATAPVRGRSRPTARDRRAGGASWRTPPNRRRDRHRRAVGRSSVAGPVRSASGSAPCRTGRTARAGR
ncbi:HipA domain-containing protein [Sphingomonas sp. 2R-10]|nr:HipA domain-containing protein [Sphingomonas sp. 2R-10]MDJ0278315.1 HipA domain-containing protein [Sphingomonas sp. 2R-10]